MCVFRIRALVFIGAMTFARGVLAQSTATNEPSALDPAIAHVVSGGAWTDDSTSGEWRAVVRNRGFEHVRSRLTIDWLAADPDSQVTRVVRSRRVTEFEREPWSLGPPKFRRDRQGWWLLIEGTNPYTLVTRSWRFRLGRPGVLAPLPRVPAG
jgi:hypothetical protein